MIGKRLRQLRAKRGLSLDGLSQLTGVSKPMLGQIERGESNPTVSTLWKIAGGLEVPFTTFIEEEKPRIKKVSRSRIDPLMEESELFHVYPLFSKETGKPFEIFSVILKPECSYLSEPHGYGVEEYIFVERGTMDIQIEEECHSLTEGEGIQFAAHFPHLYRNPHQEDCLITMLIYYYERG